MTGLRRFATVLRAPGALAPALLSIVGRLPAGMVTLAVLLLVRDRTGSYALAGLTTGAYAVALAIVSPVRARLVDRRGPTRVLLHTGIAHPLAILLLLAVVLADAAGPVVVASAGLAGLAFPPTGPVMRSLWGRLLDDPAARTTAYALEAVLIELVFVLGPLAVALAVAVADEAAAVAAAALLSGVGTLGLAAMPAVRAWHRPPPHPRTASGALASPGVRRVLLVVLTTGTAFGAIEVGVPGFADAERASGAAGLLLAVWSIGSVTGGLVYGGRDHSASPAQQYPALVVLLAVGLMLPLLAWSPLSMGVLLTVGGLTIAPVGACQLGLLSGFAPPGTATEAFAWSTTAIFVGVAAGSAMSGLLVERSGPTAGLSVAAVAGALGALIAVVGRASPLAERIGPPGS